MSTGDSVTVSIFRPPRDAFAITVLSAQVAFLSKRPVSAQSAPTELDAAQLNAHLQSRFGGQVRHIYLLQLPSKQIQQTHSRLNSVRMAIAMHKEHAVIPVHSHSDLVKEHNSKAGYEEYIGLKLCQKRAPPAKLPSDLATVLCRYLLWIRT